MQCRVYAQVQEEVHAPMHYRHTFKAPPREKMNNKNETETTKRKENTIMCFFFSGVFIPYLPDTTRKKYEENRRVNLRQNRFRRHTGATCLQLV